MHEQAEKFELFLIVQFQGFSNSNMFDQVVEYFIVMERNLFELVFWLSTSQKY